MEGQNRRSLNSFSIFCSEVPIKKEPSNTIELTRCLVHVLCGFSTEYSQNQFPLFMLEGQQLVINFEKGRSEKNECLRGLKVFLPQIFALGRLTVFLSKKTL